MPLTQADRLLAITTPLGEDVLLLQSLAGQEGVSRLFRFEVELFSEDSAISFEDLIGKAVTVAISMRDQQQRFIHGHVSRFTQSYKDERFTYYRAQIVPWLWFLTRTADCRIFQNMTAPDIIQKIFSDLGFTDFRIDVQGSFAPLDYCVQYRETDFNFVARLMEEYGIFYFFEHEESKHTLVLANAATAHVPCTGQEEAFCSFGGGGFDDADVISACQVDQELRPGKYRITDYNFETPSTNLAAEVDSVVTAGDSGRFEVYDFPGEYAKKPDGEMFVKLRIEEEEATHFLLSGTSSCRAFTTGYRFDLKDHYRQDLNQSYVLLELQHSASAGEYYSSGGTSTTGEVYSNLFTASPHSVPYRPRRLTPKPIVQGTQTAVVVGPSGEEIYTDKYGRVKVQFHWDREGQKNENSSCWIRVSQPWAGKGWGGVTIPRIGQEVIVDFLEGDPDRPIIVGRVYNAELMPPYGLPAAGVVSGGKSQTHKGSGYNEMSMNDTAGQEMITIHGQFDMATTIEHDQTDVVHNNRTTTVDVDDTETIGANQTIKVGANQTITVTANQDETISGSATRTISGSETLNVALTRTHSVGINEAISVGAAQEISVGAAQTISVGAVQAISVGASQTTSVGASQTNKVGAGQTNTIGGDQATSAANISANAKSNINQKAGSDVVIDAGSSITIKCGGASITLKGDNITLKGSKITVDGSGDVKIKGSKIGQN